MMTFLRMLPALLMVMSATYDYNATPGTLSPSACANTTTWPAPTNETCKECEFIVGFLQREVAAGNKTISDLMHFVEYICKHLKGPTAKECDMIANDIKCIVGYIDKGFNSTTICDKLHFCTTRIVPSIVETPYT